MTFLDAVKDWITTAYTALPMVTVVGVTAIFTSVLTLFIISSFRTSTNDFRTTRKKEGHKRQSSTPKRSIAQVSSAESNTTSIFESGITQMRLELREKIDALNDKEFELNDKESMLLERERELSATIREQEHRLSTKEHSLNDREAEIQIHQKEISKLELELQKRSNDLKYRENAISIREKQLNGCKGGVDMCALERSHMKRENGLNDREKELRYRQMELDRLESRLSHLQVECGNDDRYHLKITTFSV